MEKYKRYILISTIIALVVCLQVGISLAVYFPLRNDGEQDINNQLRNIESRYQISLQFNFVSFMHTVYIGEGMSNAMPYPDVYLNDFINILRIDKCPTYQYQNEYKYVPIISNADRISFENVVNVTVKEGYQISDVEFTSTGEAIFSPAANRSYYCPLTWIAPNESIAFFDFVGVDLCNVTTWDNVIGLMNNNPGRIVISRRFVLRTQTIILDIGKSILNSLGDVVSYSLNGFFIEPVISTTLIETFGDENALLYIVDENNEDIFKSELFDITSNTYSHVRTMNITDGNDTISTWTMKYKYNPLFIDNLNNSSELIVLIIMLLMFLLSNLIVIIFIFIFIKKKNDQTTNNLRLENTYISGMVNYVNHEIRNPLNAIMGLLDVTKMDLEEQKDNIKEYDSLISNVDTAYKSGILIRHIVNDVLDVRRLEEGRLQLNIRRVDMNQFVYDLNKLMARKIQENVIINFSIENNVDYIIGDSERLMQIILNILTNAFKFTEEGYIIVKFKNEKDVIRITCEDSGVGISEDKKDRIFKRFIQVDQEDNLKKLIYSRTGFGLGLYLCKMLVELMDGEIGFNSVYNEGSTFWIEFPRFLEKEANLDELV